MLIKVVIGIVVLVILALFMKAVGNESDESFKEQEKDKDKGPQILDESDFDD